MNNTVDDIYTTYNIDKSKLKRDYIKIPLKKLPRNGGGIEYEKPSDDDFKYLYSECNLPRKILAKYFNVSLSYIDKLKNICHISKTKEQSLQNYKSTMNNLYGVSNPTMLQSVKSKISQTKSERYDNPKYNNIEKMKQTKLAKYGNKFYTNHDKYISTCRKKYGTDNCLKIPKIRQQCLNTNVKKYGVEYFSQSQAYKDLYQNDEFIIQKQQKDYETKKKHNSFNITIPEQKIYQYLIQKYNDVKRQYKSEKYPFNCDFYIPSIDTYIEYQGFWTHGKEPYIGSEEQKNILRQLQSKATLMISKGKKNTQYLRAIKVWSKTDPLKREIAKKNNLNWIEFFNMNQFLDWFNMQ